MSSRSVRIQPCQQAVRGAIRPPGSKSITNRAIVCAALAEGESHLQGVLDSDDTRVMIAAWQNLGLELRHDKDTGQLKVTGSAGKLASNQADIFVGNSGTTIRFLAAALSSFDGKFKLDGVPRMRERPIGDLLRALEQLGAQIDSLNSDNRDCPPVLIHGTGLAGGLASVAGSISSQFLSGLMMAAPMAREDVVLRVAGELVSVPYVKMTAEVMRSFGARVQGDPSSGFRIEASPYRGIRYAVEPDASAASYFWAAAAITRGSARVEGLSKESLQGDVRFCEILEQMGCKVEYETDAIQVTCEKKLRGIDVDMSDVSDTVQTLAAAALFAEGPTTVRGVAHNRVKETDRIGDLATELRKFGATVQEHEDGLTIQPPVSMPESVEVETYDDHRMAMSLALVGLAVSGIEILDPGCTAKTYPNYWDDLATFSGCGIDWTD